MKKKLHNKCRKLLLFLIISFFPSISRSYPIAVSFDSLFPKSWYQKGVEASISVWQILIHAVEKREEVKFDCIIGKLAFAQFCTERMMMGDVSVLVEDKEYFCLVLEKVQSLLVEFDRYDQEEFIECSNEIIFKMIREIKELV